MLDTTLQLIFYISSPSLHLGVMPSDKTPGDDSFSTFFSETGLILKVFLVTMLLLELVG